MSDRQTECIGPQQRSSRETEERAFVPGQVVSVQQGCLQGVTGKVVEVEGSQYLIQLDDLPAGVVARFPSRLLAVAE